MRRELDGVLAGRASSAVPGRCSTSGRASCSSRCPRRRGSAHPPSPPGRQREDEAASTAGLALDPDPSAVQLDETLRERSPRPVPSRCPTPPPICWNSSKIRSWSSGAIPGPVSVTETCTIAFAPGRRDDDAAARRRELDCVREEVEDDLAEAPLVAVHDVDVRSRARARAGRRLSTLARGPSRRHARAPRAARSRRARARPARPRPWTGRARR